MLMFDPLNIENSAFTTFVLNSAELTDKLIRDFERKIDEGYDPDDVKYEVFENRNASTDDLTDSDKERLLISVKAYWEAYND